VEIRIEERVPWTELVRQELLPFHGRMAGSLRTTLAACCALIVMMVLQTPAIAQGLYLIFLISYETPYLSFRSSAFSLGYQSIGVAAALLLVIATNNSPVARVLGIAVFSTITGFLLCASPRPGLAISFGVFSLTSLSSWDFKWPAEKLVHACLWPVATGALGVAFAVAIEYLFARRDPFYALRKEFEARVGAVEGLFRSLSDLEDRSKIQTSVKEVVRFAFVGQGRILSLLQEISSRGEGGESYSENFPVMLPVLSHLLDLSANFGLESAKGSIVAGGDRLRRIAEACAAIRERRFDAVTFSPLASGEDEDLVVTPDIVGHIEQTLLAMAKSSTTAKEISMEEGFSGYKKAVSTWFVPDAWVNPDYIFFSWRIGFCATLCYILYNALNWPGITTAMVTVCIAGLNSTGAMSQKLIFRLIGSTFGGAILGIGSVALLFPYTDRITALVIVLGIVTFLGAWVSRSPHFGYVGLQIAFSFYLVVFEQFSPTTSPTTDMRAGRDRLIGIGLALVVMYFVFIQVKPKRTVMMMRLALAKVLSSEAELVSLSHSDAREAEKRRTGLREMIAMEIAAIESMAELIPFEMGTNRTADLEISDGISNATLRAGNLFLNLSMWLQSRKKHESGENGEFGFNRDLSESLSYWADCLQPGDRTGSKNDLREPLRDLTHAQCPEDAVQIFDSHEGLIRQLRRLCNQF
jgi:multidrug resistance protein MdtO